MESGLAQFVEVYAQDKKLTQTEAGILLGALTYKSIQKLDSYKEFVLTLGSVAPQLLAVVEMANKEAE